VPGEKFCKVHLTWDENVQARALQDAIAIERLENKVVLGKATKEDVLAAQRQSLTSSTDPARKSLMEIALEEEAKIQAEEETKPKTRLGRMTARFTSKKTKKPLDTKVIKAPARSFDSMGGKAYHVLGKQNSETSNVVISSLSGDPLFDGLAQTEMESTMKRDAEDGEKLAVGIQIAIDKSVLSKMEESPTYFQVDVLGKTADAVADEIIAEVGADATSVGVIVLCGLSGTGKGTTVAKLVEKLPKTVAWSNGNIFRSVAMLCSLHCKQNSTDFDEGVLTPENLANWVAMLHFQYDPQHHSHDIQIQAPGLGVDSLVSQITCTNLQSPEVNAILPTVAKYIQGEVIKFANDATAMMCSDGNTVIFEGRAQTVNYVDTPHRFELIMSDPLMIGKRGAAQRIAALALQDCEMRRVPSRISNNADDDASIIDDPSVMASVKRALAKLCGVAVDDATGDEASADRERDDSVWPKRVPTAANEGEAVFINGAAPAAAAEGDSAADRAERADSVWPKRVPTAANEGEAVFIKGAAPTPEQQAILDAEVAAAAAVSEAAVEKEAEEAKAAASAEPDYAALMTEIYQKYNPEKLQNPGFVASTLARYAGKEEALIEHLRSKYEKV
jgi:cytidylate kinase